MTPMRGARRPRAMAATDLAVPVLVALYAGLLVDEIVSQFAPAALTVAGLIASAVALLAIQTVHSLRTMRSWRDRTWPVTLGVQAVLCLVWLPAYAELWLGFLGFFLASCALLLPPRWTLAAVALSIIVVFLHRGYSLGDVVYVDCTYIVVASMIWGLCTSADLSAQLAATRARAAQAELEREQERLGRDLDVLVGERLVAIRDRTATAAASVGCVPAAVAMRAVVALSRAALADVRTIANGDRPLSLATRLQLARTVLATAGIELRAELPTIELPGPVDAVLSQVVRETVTAIVQRRGASTCRVTLTLDESAAVLTVASDAAAADSTFRQLGEKVRASGGALSIDDGGTVIRARLPITATSPTPSPAAPRPGGYARSAS